MVRPPNWERLEKWKPVDGFEKYYSVSNMGRVVRLERKRPLRKTKGTYNKTIIIVTGDHGDMLGEELDQTMLFGHNVLIYPNLRVPFLIIPPNNERKVINDVVGLVQIPEIIKHLLGFENKIILRKGIFSYIPLLSDIFELILHRTARFVIINEENFDIVSMYNISNNEISELRMDNALGQYLLPEITGDFSSSAASRIPLRNPKLTILKDPIAYPLVTAFVVLPTASSGSVTLFRISSGILDISAIPPALSVIGPKASIATTIPVMESIAIAAIAIP